MNGKLLAPSTTALLAAMTSIATFGCLEVKVIHVDEHIDAGDDATLRDLDVTVDGQRPCEACLREPNDPGPGCANETAICAGDPTCAATFACALAHGCFERANQGEVIDCGTPCAVDAGLNPTTPSINYIINLVTCAQAQCGAICRGEAPPAP